MLVVVGELGFDDVVPTGQQAFGRFLHRGEELVLVGAWPVAAHHVVCFVNCRRKQEDGGHSLGAAETSSAAELLSIDIKCGELASESAQCSGTGSRSVTMTTES